MKRNVNNYEIVGINWNYKTNDLPVVEIKTESREDGKTYSFYLMPFRKYCFQFCETKDGEGDMGSSEVMHYETFKEFPYYVTTSILTDACRSAITQFVKPHGWGNVVGRIDTNCDGFKAFIDRTHRFIYGTASNYIINDDIVEEKEAEESETTNDTTPFIEYWKGELKRYKEENK